MFVVYLPYIIALFRYMWKENLYQPVEILVRSHEVFPIAEHQHSFFEMVYVKAGTGRFYVKEAGYKVQEVSYHEKSLFLIPPETTHCFTIDTHSDYVFIRFVLHYVEDYIGKYIAEVFRSPSQQAEISLAEQEDYMVSHLFDFIVREEGGKQEGCNYLQQQWLNSILVVVARNIARNASFKDFLTGEATSSMHMLQYIQQHIHQPDLLTAESLAKVFNLSPNYIGSYFKRHFQESLRQYIARNRLKMVENLLLNSKMTIKEIAYRMGYTDSCYLVKSFQKVYGVPPSKYRLEHSHDGACLFSVPH